jgi:hypothetical protein
MRDLIVPRLRERWPSARIIHELPLRYSTNRIDLAAVTETDIIAVEIKSSKDVADRLEAQLRGFQRIASRMIVALAPHWNEKLPPLITKEANCTSYTERRTETQEIIYRTCGSGVDVWTVDADAGTVEVTQSSYRDSWPWAYQLLHMLHVSELAAIASRHGCWQGKRPVHLDLVNACAELMTGGEVRRAVCSALRARPAFGAASDQPILFVPVASADRKRQEAGA